MKSNQAKQKSTVLDLDPDAWPKFEALVKSAAKMGHKPHTEDGKRGAPEDTPRRRLAKQGGNNRGKPKQA